MIRTKTAKALFKPGLTMFRLHIMTIIWVGKCTSGDDFQT
jgi:hypothetical protein